MKEPVVTKLVIAALVALLVLPLAAWAQPKVSISIVAEKEAVVAENGKKVKKMVKARDVMPGEVITYTLNYHNTGNETATNARRSRSRPSSTRAARSATSVWAGARRARRRALASAEAGARQHVETYLPAGRWTGTTSGPASVRRWPHGEEGLPARHLPAVRPRRLDRAHGPGAAVRDRAPRGPLHDPHLSRGGRDVHDLRGRQRDLRLRARPARHLRSRVGRCREDPPHRCSARARSPA